MHALQAMFAKQPPQTDSSAHLDISAMLTRDVLVPVVPVFVEGGDTDTEVVDLVLSAGEINTCLQLEQQPAGQARTDGPTVPGHWAGHGQRGAVSTTASHACEVWSCYGGCIDYIEATLMQQLTAAIGKVVGPDELVVQLHEIPPTQTVLRRTSP